MAEQIDWDNVYIEDKSIQGNFLKPYGAKEYDIFEIPIPTSDGKIPVLASPLTLAPYFLEGNLPSTFSLLFKYMIDEHISRGGGYVDTTFPILLSKNNTYTFVDYHALIIALSNFAVDDDQWDFINKYAIRQGVSIEQGRSIALLLAMISGTKAFIAEPHTRKDARYTSKPGAFYFPIIVGSREDCVPIQFSLFQKDKNSGDKNKAKKKNNDLEDKLQETMQEHFKLFNGRDWTFKKPAQVNAVCFRTSVLFDALEKNPRGRLILKIIREWSEKLRILEVGSKLNKKYWEYQARHNRVVKEMLENGEEVEGYAPNEEVIDKMAHYIKL